MDARETELSCLDEVPSRARQAARQQLLARWFYAIALAPFSVVVFVGLRFFADSRNRLFDALIGLTLAWAMGVAAYTFYMLFFMKCPRCGWRFGSGVACSSCKLPRHSDSTPASMVTPNPANGGHSKSGQLKGFNRGGFQRTDRAIARHLAHLASCWPQSVKSQGLGDSVPMSKDPYLQLLRARVNIAVNWPVSLAGS